MCKNRITILAFLVFFIFGSSVYGQTPSALLNVSASNAVVLEPRSHYEGVFRVVFQITSTEGNIPFSAIDYSGYGPELLDWNAYLTSGGACVALAHDTTGIDITEGRGARANGLEVLADRNTTRTYANTQRPSYVSTVFGCDLSVEETDVSIVQISIYMYVNENWENRIYSFERIPFAD